MWFLSFSSSIKNGETLDIQLKSCYNIAVIYSIAIFWPRASINLALAARTYAFIKRRGYVIPEDVRAVAHDVLRHRIGLTYEAEANNMTSDEIISKILNKVEVP